MPTCPLPESEPGDPRFDPELWWLPKEPDLGFLEIPEGSFLMGSDPKDDPNSTKDERPRHSVTLPAFWIGRYPVTVEQYGAFVEASRYSSEDPDWQKGSSTQPVVWVTWYDALAYCRWLGERLRNLALRHAMTGSQQLWSGLASGKLQASLPSEAEWEKAARGREGLIYPWGKGADANRANYASTGLGERSVVGCFPSGASPYGIEELSGNVWEWTRSLDGAYPYAPIAIREDLGAFSNTIRILRGGAFSFSYVRCAVRSSHVPVVRNGSIGFRVVLSPFRPLL